MKKEVLQPAALAGTFMWIGLVSGISFLEAWLKFRAPGVTLPIGLGIGRLVFNALNKIEWVLAAVIILSALRYGRPLWQPTHRYLLIIITILIIQTCWLLPQLDARAEQYIQHQPVNPSHLHIYFVAAEVLKTLLLAAYGVSLFKRQ